MEHGISAVSYTHLDVYKRQVMMLTALTDQSCKERRESKTHRFFEKITEFDRLSLTKDNIIITGRKKQFNVTQNAVMKIVTTGKSVCL